MTRLAALLGLEQPVELFLDPSGGLLPGQVSGALTVEVMGPDGGGLIDSESTIAITQPDAGNGRFVGQAMAAIDGVVAVDDDGILSVVDGAEMIATYLDADGPTVLAKATISCRPNLDLATISIPGVNQSYNVEGGCDAPRRRESERGEARSLWDRVKSLKIKVAGPGGTVVDTTKPSDPNEPEEADPRLHLGSPR